MKRFIYALSLVGLSFSALSAPIVLTDDDFIPGDTQGFETYTDPTAPLGSGAWRSTTVGGDGDKSWQWLYWDGVNDNQVGVGTIDSLSFWTNKPTAGEELDYFLQIFTHTDGSADSGWFGQRLTFNAGLAANTNAPANQWNFWSTDGVENQLLVHDWTNDTQLADADSNDTIYDAPNMPTLQQLLDANYIDDQASVSGIDYGSETIMGIAISTGSGWADNYEGAIDAVSINFNDQTSWQYDLESSATDVPEPPMILLMMAGALGLIWRSRRR